MGAANLEAGDTQVDQQRRNVQLPLNLEPKDPYSLDYFVPHSGVVEAVAHVEQALEECLADPGAFRLVFVYGADGSGKRHLLEGYAKDAIARGMAPRSVKVYACALQEFVEDEEVSRFISSYESLRSGGGLLLVSSPCPPAELTSNPHVSSRILSGVAVALKAPQEEELHPLVLSLIERHNLKLGERSIEYLMRRLPVDPLSFDAIFSRINEISFSQNRPARFGVVREAFAEEIVASASASHETKSTEAGD